MILTSDTATFVSIWEGPHVLEEWTANMWCCFVVHVTTIKNVKTSLVKTHQQLFEGYDFYTGSLRNFVRLSGDSVNCTFLKAPWTNRSTLIRRPYLILKKNSNFWRWKLHHFCCQMQSADWFALFNVDDSDNGGVCVSEEVLLDCDWQVVIGCVWQSWQHQRYLAISQLVP